jgi:hypothetical protein
MPELTDNRHVQFLDASPGVKASLEGGDLGLYCSLLLISVMEGDIGKTGS